jgi:hypothetical protein
MDRTSVTSETYYTSIMGTYLIVLLEKTGNLTSRILLYILYKVSIIDSTLF